jgi:hypothetical protein
MENISDHNREEASKAKEIALEKMEKNDFHHAQQIRLEAQELCPQLAEKCESSAIYAVWQNLLWAVRKTCMSADETMITKQYHNIAL